MKIAVTGHRPDKLGHEYDGVGQYSDRVRAFLQSVIDDHKPLPLILISGMALGVDTIWALLAMKNHLPLIAAIPCIGQELRWQQDNVDTYNRILAYNQCYEKIVSHVPYNGRVMQARNEWMVNECDVLVAVWNGSKGGTANCIQYARSKNKHIIYFNPTL